MAFFPILFKPKAKPMETVVLPTPALVGVMAVTKIRWCFLIFASSMQSMGTLAI